METKQLTRDNPVYPEPLSLCLGQDAPSRLTLHGNLAILRNKKLAIFCSSRCPAKLILEAHDFARRLTEINETIISGFHSPVERECLTILLRGNQPIIICPPRSLKKMRIRREYRKAVEKGRLLFLSFFPDNRHRADVQMALQRNRFVASLADNIFVAYAAPSSKTPQFCREILNWRKPVYTINSPHNADILKMGVEILREPAALS